MKAGGCCTIFGKGNRALVVNYRPIAISNNFSKICQNIYDHLSFNFKSKLHPNMDDSVSHAFNKVPHTLLLDKLHNFGLSSFYIKWFQSYLLNRSSFVPILGKFSSPFSVMSGVPQGSTLGPLLTFLLTICLLELIIPNFSYLPMI
jgi:hypothetical protein